MHLHLATNPDHPDPSLAANGVDQAAQGRTDAPITVRQLGPDDRHHIEAVFTELSDQDRYYRFLRPMPTYPPAVMDLLTAMDGHDHVAVGAFVGSTCVGVARFIRSSRRPTSAEVAVTVSGRCRGRGLARRMIAQLDDLAAERDLDRFEIYVHPENRRAARLFRSLGFHLAYEDGTLEGERPVLSGHPAAAALALAA